MRRLSYALVAVLALAALLAASPAMAQAPTWGDYPGNPVVDPAPGGIYKPAGAYDSRAYYPSALYSATGFDGNGPSWHYKMYYDDGTHTWLVYSNDFKTWYRYGVAPVISNLRHPNVCYDANHFGQNAGDLIQASSPQTYAVAPYYKMWLWDLNMSIKFAYSADGEQWFTNYTRAALSFDGQAGWYDNSTPVYDLNVVYDAADTPPYHGYADKNGVLHNLISSDGTTWTLSPAQPVALPPQSAGTATETVTYYARYQGAGPFTRSGYPMSAPASATQERSGDKVTLRITGATGYTDSGFVTYFGKLGDLSPFTLTGTGDTFGCNLYFDRNADGEFFTWNVAGGPSYTGTGADAYILGSGSVGGVKSVSDDTTFTSLNPGGGNYTVAQLKAGAAPGITSSTPIAIWVGINTSSGDMSATVSIPQSVLAWDRTTGSRMSVVKVSDTEWHAWYGASSPWPPPNYQGAGGNMGIGYATSADGVHWTKEAGNPIRSLGGSQPYNGLGTYGTWNDERNYAMSVVYDPGLFGGYGESAPFKMVRSGRRNSDGNYSLGVAFADATRTVTALSSAASTGSVLPGQFVTIWGTLTSGGASISGPTRAVVLEADTGSGFAEVGPATYDVVTDTYWATVAPTVGPTTYRLAFAGDGSFAPCTSAGQVVSVTTPPNRAPVAVDDFLATAEDTTLALPAPGVLGNDSDPDGDTLTVDDHTAPGHGVLGLSADGSLTYRPDADWSGTDSFTYVAWDGALLSGWATVTVTVSPVNDAPIARDDTATVDEDTTLTVAAPGVLANDSDPEGDPIYVIGHTSPAHGSVTIAGDGGYEYVPAPDFNGIDTFRYRIADDTMLSNWATVTITVNPVDEPLPPALDRVDGADRYEVAAALAAMQGPGYDDTTHVIIASGLDAAAADPLSASGITGIYDAPLLLVRGDWSRTLPTATRNELIDIGNGNGDRPVRVHIVGGPKSVPDSLKSVILGYLPAGSTIERIDGADRYAVAANVSTRMRTVLGGSAPTTAFVTNGSDPRYFWSALAASPVTARQHFPILPVKRTSIPGPISAVLPAYTTRIIVAGSEIDSGTVGTALQGPGITVERIGGADRYRIALNFANRALAEGWLHVANVAIAAKIPDALTGGSTFGSVGLDGPILYTASTGLNASTQVFLTTRQSEIVHCYVIGGTASIPPGVYAQIAAALGIGP
jgi:VCBS repeat-containing protein